MKDAVNNPARDDGVKGLVKVMTAFALIMLVFGYAIGILTSKPTGSFLVVGSDALVNHGQFYQVTSMSQSAGSLTLTAKSQMSGIVLDSIVLYFRLANGSIATTPWQKIGHDFTLSTGDTVTFTITISPALLDQATDEAVVITQIANQYIPQIGAWAGDEFPVQINLPA